MDDPVRGKNHMGLFASRHAGQRISSSDYVPFSRAPYTHNEASRHDPTIGTPTIPPDPFVVWMEKREADDLLKRESDVLIKREQENMLQRG
jgi:hypothetical protein